MIAMYHTTIYKRLEAATRRHAPLSAFVLLAAWFMLAAPAAAAAQAAGIPSAAGDWPWWLWSSLLGLFCFGLGVVAVPAGVGGGVLFVPFVGALFPFGIDFVRGAGLLVALAGAVSAGPRLTRSGLSDLDAALPYALVCAVCSAIGARFGLALPEAAVNTALGATILGVAALLAAGMRPSVPGAEAGAAAPPSRLRRLCAYPLFAAVGFAAGLFGLGAGWANVPVLVLVLGLPLKLAVGTSSLLIALTSPAAAAVYLGSGAILPSIAVPAALGMMAGTRLGARLLPRLPTRTVRACTLGFLALAGLRSLGKGLAIWG